MAPKLVKIKLLEEGSHLGRKGAVVEVPETMVPHLVQLRHQHDGTKLVPFRLACLADESEALEAAKVLTVEDAAHLTQAEADAAGIRVVAGGDKADVGAVSQVAAEKRAAEAEAAAEAEVDGDDADEADAADEGDDGADEAPEAPEAEAEAPKSKRSRKAKQK